MYHVSWETRVKKQNGQSGDTVHTPCRFVKNCARYVIRCQPGGRPRTWLVLSVDRYDAYIELLWFCKWKLPAGLMLSRNRNYIEKMLYCFGS